MKMIVTKWFGSMSDFSKLGIYAFALTQQIVYVSAISVIVYFLFMIS